MTDEYEEHNWETGVCPHGEDEATHCHDCCIDIGDAERSMRFDWAGIELRYELDDYDLTYGDTDE